MLRDGWFIYSFASEPAHHSHKLLVAAFWSRARTKVAGIFLLETAEHSGLHKFHNCILRRGTSRRELFVKIPSQPLNLGKNSFSHYPRIVTRFSDSSAEYPIMSGFSSIKSAFDCCVGNMPKLGLSGSMMDHIILPVSKNNNY